MTAAEMRERLARIIDPEAFGLPPHDLGEFGMTDRDEARMKANLVLEALVVDLVGAEE